ncbi:pentapeptide repeat-containing protein [Streptomyces sp. NPDC005529]|uniref:pentapeptide repeat-containing protein n=1 Tax=unclassified Streptomyces TaxID=2593676 RepID=UPI0033A20FBE
MRPGSDLDHRGVTLTESLLERLLEATRHPATGQKLLGAARFDDALFVDDANFDGVRFTKEAGFEGAVFRGAARFVGADFHKDVGFERARFRSAQFRSAAFHSNAWFAQVSFTGDVRFDEVRFSGHARFGFARFSNAAFDGAQFIGGVDLQGAHFTGRAWFDGARFKSAGRFGPLVCDEAVDLSHVTFEAPIVIEAAAKRIWCAETEWSSRAHLRLRYATVDLSDAVLGFPLTITSRSVPFPGRGGEDWSVDALPEDAFVGRAERVHIASLSGVDAAQVVLHDVDLTGCRLSGALHLDGLRQEGECSLAYPPTGMRPRRLLPVRWTRRRTLVEEHFWRAARGWHGWAAAPTGVEVVEPAALAAVYRQLRKSFEDAKNEPDAADFYYGEMEMRRHDRKRPRAERVLLVLYWAVSGYGLRASRALGWLATAMAATVLVMMLWGVPKADAGTQSTGTLTGHRISVRTGGDASAAPDGPLNQRVTSQRLDRSLRVVINSVVFRSSSQDLTVVGTYAEMLSRIVEPALLGLAVLAARNRVKR